MGGYSVTSDLDIGKKVGNLDFGGVFCNFGFGHREKSWKFGFWGGVFCNFGFGLRKKSWKFGFGGVFCNFGFGLRKKKLEIWIGGGYSVKVMEKKKTYFTEKFT